MLKVIVKRSKWLRGEGAEASTLYRKSDGKMCCLGFACVTAKIPVKDLMGVDTPVQVYNELCDLPKPLSRLVVGEDLSFSSNSDICEDLMDVNDDPVLKESHREEALKKIGKQVGLDFSFVD